MGSRPELVDELESIRSRYGIVSLHATLAWLVRAEVDRNNRLESKRGKASPTTSNPKESQEKTR